MFLVGPLHSPFEFVVGVVNGVIVGHKGTGLINSFGHLLVLPYDFVAPHQSQLVLLQLPGSYQVVDLFLGERILTFCDSQVG